MKLLVIEDDKTTGGYICDGLREEGHSVDLFTSGSEGLIQASIGQYDVMIVDRMLPGIDGISLVKTLRGTKNNTPALFLELCPKVGDGVIRRHG